MSADVSAGTAREGVGHRAGRIPRIVSLRDVIIFAGLLASVLFVVFGLSYELQLYADGSIFSYAIAARDAWAFHWHNISGRLTVYLLCHVPAELYVQLTGDARGGIAFYGSLFFGSQLLGLALTFAADRSRSRVIFVAACLSTACLLPLVFGYPTEMWVTHALFWPALALCHYARPSVIGTFTVITALTALILTHESGVVFASTAVATLLLRGPKDASFRVAAATLLAALAIWAAIKLMLQPDQYFAAFLVTLALNAVNIANLGSDIVVLLAGTLVVYGLTVLLFLRVAPAHAYFCAAGGTALPLIIHWLWFDASLHAADRYPLRTALLIGTPLVAAIATLRAVDTEGRLILPIPLLDHLRAVLGFCVAGPAAVGALFLVLLVHTVETAKFVVAWSDYKTAIRGLAMGQASDPALGNARFVSSKRIADARDRLAWYSTTQFLSVLVAPQFAPQRLVINPQPGYFWLSCATAAANEEADRVVPAASRRLIRTHACLHR